VSDILNLGASYGECVNFTFSLFLPRENMDMRLSGPQGKQGRFEGGGGGSLFLVRNLTPFL